MSDSAVQTDEGRTTLQLLHATDLEGNADAVEAAPNFAAVLDALRPTHEVTLLISSGDNYIPSPFSNAAASSDPAVVTALSDALNAAMSAPGEAAYAALEPDAGRIDIAMMNLMGFDASVVGNHELDFGQAQFARVVTPDDAGTAEPADDPWMGTAFPYLSANLEIGPESVLAPLHRPAGVAADESGAGTIAPFAVVESGGERFGIVGATTQILEDITSVAGDPANPDDDLTVPGETNDMALLAQTLQPVIDTLEADGVDKIILTSHLQDFALERELAGLLDGADIIIAGGSDTRLADDTDVLREGDEAQGPYPILVDDAAGDPVAVLSTDGQYTYLGRLVVDFDADGRLVPDSIDPAVSGAYATDEAGVLAATGAADLETALNASPTALAVRSLVDAVDDAVLQTLGRTVLGAQAADLNGERSPGVRTEETNLGNLTADANLAAARELTGETVHASIKNGGGIRASIPLGDPLTPRGISTLEVQQALAFNNALTVLTLSPAELVAVLEHSVAESTYEADGTPTNAPGRFPQVAGLAFSFDPERPAGERVREVILREAGPDGEDVALVEGGSPTKAADDFSKGIRVVTLSFLADGGDGYPFAELANAERVDLKNETLVRDGKAQFTNVGTEQDVLAEYLLDNFAPEGEAAPFAAEDVPAVEDMRIVNLTIDGAELQ